MCAASFALILGLLSGLGVVSGSECGALVSELEAHRKALGIFWKAKGPELSGHPFPDWVILLAEQASLKEGNADDGRLPVSNDTEGAVRPLSQNRRAASTEAQNETCKDNENWVDSHKFPCSSWKGHSCDEWPGYTAEELEEVMQNCPEACLVCAHHHERHENYTSTMRNVYAGVLVAYTLTLSLTICLSVYLSRHWWAGLIVRVLRCKCSGGRTAHVPQSFEDLAGHMEWQLTEYVRTHKHLFRRQFSRVPVVLSVFLTAEYIGYQLNWATEPECGGASMTVEIIKEISTGVSSILLATLLLPSSVLGERGYTYSMLAVQLMFAGTQVNFSVNELVGFLPLFKQSAARLVLLLCLEFKTAAAVCIAHLVYLQCSYMWSFGMEPMAAFKYGKCIDLLPLNEGIGMSHLMTLDSSEVSPWRCLFVHSGITFIFLVCLAIMDSLLERTMQRQAQLIAVESHQTALMSIMRATCDCIVYLDSNFTICAPSPKLSALLLHSDGQQTSVKGRNLRELMMSEEDWERLHTMMSTTKSAPADDQGDGQADTASTTLQVSHVVHVSLRDALGTMLNVQCFWAQSVNLQGEICYTLGITEESEVSQLKRRYSPESHQESNSGSPDWSEDMGDYAMRQMVLPAIGDIGLLSIPEGSCITPKDDLSEVSSSSEWSQTGQREHAALIAGALFPFQVVGANKTLEKMFFKGKAVPRGMGSFDNWFRDRGQALDFSRFIVDKINAIFYSADAMPWPLKVPFGTVDLHPPGGKRKRNVSIEVELVEPEQDSREGMELQDYCFVIRLGKFKSSKAAAAEKNRESEQTETSFTSL
eukprot:gb/GFBE01017136.1/.p1 GENE.gb/GFBE01017136.1/~~gb/GFBE01017136.1/.p1  ORF type:complete len:818 (+),score=130.76 gb/GFBE01017136.1/:1-2454(+)